MRTTPVAPIPLALRATRLFLLHFAFADWPQAHENLRVGGHFGVIERRHRKGQALDRPGVVKAGDDCEKTEVLCQQLGERTEPERLCLIAGPCATKRAAAWQWLARALSLQARRPIA
jgi:hypothetical protein